MIGYKMPSSDMEFEITWDAIAVLYKDFPYSSEKIKNGEYRAKDLGSKINWCNSYNASYDRMFGRGKLCSNLTDKKILIIGTGAIGSSLLLSLLSYCWYDLYEGHLLSARFQYIFQIFFSLTKVAFA